VSHNLGASGPGTVLLDLGPGTGALVLHTGPTALGREIEISRAGDEPGRRTHAAVRQRLVPDGVRYAAVYPDLPEGRYTVWADAHTAAATVEVRGGAIAEFRYP
jgi:hypothetical protein